METTQSPQTITPELRTRVRELERELMETEKALAQETLEHARTKETLAYTRGLLDRADKSETAIHKYLDKQEERHQQIVGKLEEKAIDANRKIATIARELGAKEERVALLSGPGKLTGVTPEIPAAAAKEPVSLPLDVPIIWAALGIVLTVGILSAPGWSVSMSRSASGAVWAVITWFVMKFWFEFQRAHGQADAKKLKRLKTVCHSIAAVAALCAAIFFGISIFAIS